MKWGERAARQARETGTVDMKDEHGIIPVTSEDKIRFTYADGEELYQILSFDGRYAKVRLIK